ncbi:MAG TPA: hypothetical protein VD905_12475 [Flavobacteriales bacterium]|nr:hypothetical protein [Flavobacteriales bacterium]
MKYSGRLFVLLGFCIAILCLSGKPVPGVDNAEVNEFAKKVLAAFQTKNYVAYKSLLMTNAEFTDMVMASEVDEESKVQTIEMYEEGLEEDKQLEFDAFIDHMAEFGIDFAGIDFQKTEVEEYTEYGVNVVNCAVYFTDRKNDYMMGLLSCFKTKNGWKLSRIPVMEPPKEKDESCEPFTRQIMGLLANKDEKTFHAKIMTNEEVVTMVKRMNLGEETEKMVLEQLEREGPMRNANKWYTDFQEDLADSKLDLNKGLQHAVFAYMIRTEKGVAAANMTCSMVADNKNYEVSFIAVKTDAGWKIVDRIRFDYEGKYSMDYAMPDSTYYDPYADSIAVYEYEKELQRMQHEMDSTERAMREDSVRRAEEYRLEKEKKKKKKK